MNNHKYDKTAITTVMGIGMATIIFSVYNSSNPSAINILTALVGIIMVIGGVYLISKLCKSN